jgi:hypothetical protein
MQKRYLLFFIVLAVFVWYGAAFLDPDFGWHLKMGEYITRLGIPANDPFSYSMPSYPFIDHEWLTNVIIYALYISVGYGVLAGLFSLLALAAVLFSLTTSKAVWGMKAPLFLLGATILLGVSGVRPQVLSWLFVAILIVLLRSELCKRRLFYLPLIFGIWVNLHGSFAVGLVILSLFLATRWISAKKLNFKELAVLASSFLASILNPYGLRIWVEVWMQVSDSHLRWSIAEWWPSLLSLHFSFIFASALFLGCFRLFWQHWSKEYMVVAVFLFAAALSSQRHIPLWFLWSIPLLADSFQRISQQAHDQIGRRRIAIALRWLMLAVTLLFLQQLYTSYSFLQGFSEQKYYPTQAISYLRTNVPEGNILAPYNWGGYLIWKLPEKKVFVDGRMPSWRWTAPVGESDWAFKELQTISSGEGDLSTFLQKYHIDTVLWVKESSPSTTKLDVFLSNLEKKVGRSTDNSQFTLPVKLEHLGWKKIYQDSNTAIYQAI